MDLHRKKTADEKYQSHEHLRKSFFSNQEISSHFLNPVIVPKKQLFLDNPINGMTFVTTKQNNFLKSIYSKTARVIPMPYAVLERHRNRL
uniref:Uncharacterized protein n=1 Tax=Romanomermis culicivorax TaxID=13658 RepID=A0A915KCB8_ROMCU